MQKTPAKFLISTVLLILLAITNLQAQEGVVTVNQDKQIDALLRLKKDINRTESNYKIQIYNGNREGAEKSRIAFRKSFSDLPTNMKFETPNYKIWIGNFKTRLEADRALLTVKKKFRNAFVFKPKKNKK